MFESIHIDALSGELHAFQFQPRSLFVSGGATQLDLTACAQHPMPRKLVSWISSKQASNGAVIARISRCGCDSAVGAYFSRRNRKDHTTKGDVPFVVRTQAIPAQLSLGLFTRELIGR